MILDARNNQPVVTFNTSAELVGAVPGVNYFIRETNKYFTLLTAGENNYLLEIEAPPEPPKPKYLWRVVAPEWLGYDYYEGFVCVAPDEQTARQTHPSEYHTYDNGDWYRTDLLGNAIKSTNTSWIAASEIHTLSVTQIGVAHDEYEFGTVILADYNAG